jgi:hypothetical protein
LFVVKENEVMGVKIVGLRGDLKIIQNEGGMD